MTTQPHASQQDRPERYDIEAVHDLGLRFDLATLGRRRALRLLGGAALVPLVGCSSDDGGTAAGGTTSPAAATGTGGPASTAATNALCEDFPSETAGPFPGDGSNGPNVLDDSGVVRSDIRSSFAGATGVAEGVPLTIDLALLDLASGCGPLVGAAVYAWHCDREGRYSLYSSGVTEENYLRGVQVSDDAGRLRFVSIFPGAYAGRWPHVHFEVYRSVSDATGGGRPALTSQLALPQDVCDAVYATPGYEHSAANLSRITLQSDNVFGDDGGVRQLATTSGDVTTGFTAALNVPV